jgi:FkbM family methyltransferase
MVQPDSIADSKSADPGSTPGQPARCERCPSPGTIELAIDGRAGWLCDPCARPIVAHVTSTPTMTDAAIQTPIQVTSRGKVFRVLVSGEAWHPSFWSFLDELETRESWWTINPGDVVADIGADFGSYSLSALAQGAATVYAWSPPFKLPDDPIECRTLRRSAELNGWQNRLICFDTGLWSKPGYVTVTDWNKLGEWTREAAKNPEAVATFPVGTLDDLGLTRLDWAKLDVEGAELEILRGAEQTIRACRPRILFENHVHVDLECEAKCRAFLEAMGYRWVGTRQHHAISHTLMIPGDT